MDRLKFKFVLAVIAVLTLTSCGGSTGRGSLIGDTQPPFSIEVQDTSFFGGGSLEGVSVTTTTDAGKLIAEVSIDDAANLKGVFFELHYDASSWHPVVAAPTELLAPSDSLLHLAVLDDPGVVHFGEVILNPDTLDGFSGSGTVARVEFESGAVTEPNKSKEKTASQAPQIGLSWWSADTLLWKYTNPGDYDLNGEVNLADIVPVALHYGTIVRSTDPRHIKLIDGDLNYEINLADLSVIAKNHGNSRIHGYDLFSTDNTEGLPENNGAVNGPDAVFESHIPFSQMLPEDSEFVDATRFFDFMQPLSAVSTERYYWLEPVEILSSYGLSSTIASMQFLTPNIGLPRVWSDDDGVSVIWAYDNTSDYNQDGLVSIADIETMILFYGEFGPFEYLAVQSVVDGDNNGDINLADISSIIINYFSFVSGYNLYSSDEITDYVEYGDLTIDPIYSVSMAEAEGDPSVDRLTFSYHFGGSTPTYVWVRPFGGDGSEGASSDLLTLIE